MTKYHEPFFNDLGTGSEQIVFRPPTKSSGTANGSANGSAGSNGFTGSMQIGRRGGRRAQRQSDYGSTEIKGPNRRPGSSTSFNTEADETVVSWTCRMASLTKSSGNLKVSIRANQKTTERLVVHWQAECATEWAKYQNLSGTIVINAGEDRGTSDVTIENLNTFSSSESRNVAHKRSRFEIDQVDQIVLRLDRIEGDAIIKPDARRCYISILDDREMQDRARNFI